MSFQERLKLANLHRQFAPILLADDRELDLRARLLAHEQAVYIVHRRHRLPIERENLVAFAQPGAAGSSSHNFLATLR